MKDKSTSALVCGILSIVFCVIAFFAFGWLAIAGLILSIYAVINGSKTKSESSKGLAGFILGVIGIPLSAVDTVLYIIALINLATLVA